VVPENVYTREGDLMSKIFKGKFEQKLEFQVRWGGRDANHKRSIGRV